MASTESTMVRWGILGTGAIAGAFADGLVSARRGKLAAVGSRDSGKARAFVDARVPAAAAFAGRAVTAHGSYEALLADPHVDAVYVSTPHPDHERWAVAAARAGKHVLCEKPLGVTARQAERIVAAARSADVFLMEAFMYRCHPQTARLIELVRTGAVGRVRAIRATFAFRAPFDPASRLYDKALAGGGILDVGCYPVSMARLIAGAATAAPAERPFAEPETDPATGRPAVFGAGYLGTTGVDEYAAAVIRFPHGVIAQVATGVGLDMGADVVIFGEDGRIEVPMPWVPAREGGVAEMFVHRAGGSAPPQRVTVETDQQIYGLEADVAAEGIERWRRSALGDPGRGQALAPAMTWEDSLGNMRTLDAWRAAIGLRYREDEG